MFWGLLFCGFGVWNLGVLGLWGFRALGLVLVGSSVCRVLKEDCGALVLGTWLFVYATVFGGLGVWVGFGFGLRV